MSAHGVQFENVPNLKRLTIMVVGPDNEATQSLCRTIERCGQAALGPVAEVSLGVAIVANIIVDEVIIDASILGAASFACHLAERRLSYTVQTITKDSGELALSSQEQKGVDTPPRSPGT